MKRVFLLLFVTTILWTGISLFAADPLNSWTLRSPIPTPNPMRDIAYGNGLWVAVGDSGTIITSPDDGNTWALQNSGVTNNFSRFSGIVFTNNLFVAVGDYGLAATSPNGTNWSLHVAGNANSFWSAVTFASGRFVAVGQDVSGVTSNNVAISLNGTNWSVFPSGHNGLISDVAFAQGVFVGVGAGFGFGAGVVLGSANGTNWTRYVTNFYANLTGVTYGNGKFVGVGGSGTVLSTNGTNWTLVTNGLAPSRIGVTYGNGVFVSVGSSAPYYVDGVSYTSTNGSNWVFASLPSSETVRFANGKFAAVGAPTAAEAGLAASVYFSTNGSSWNFGNPAFGGAFRSSNERWRGLVYGGGQFAFLSENLSVRLSTNLVDFTMPYGSVGMRSLAFGDNQFVVAVTNAVNTTFVSSANSWSLSGYASGFMNAMCFSNSLWVGVGQDGYIAVSADATYWTDVTTSITNHLLAVAPGAGVFVAVGAGGMVARSVDGNIWTSQSLGASNELRAVTYGGGLFVAVGYSGKIFTSSDGNAWTARSSGTLLSLNAVGRCFGRFVAVGDGGTVISSTDGITWTRAATTLDLNLRGVAASADLAGIVGDYGALLTSTDGLNWKSAIGSGAYSMWKVINYNGQFIAAMDNGVAFSGTGRSWTSRSLVGSMYSVLGQGNLLLATGSGLFVNQSIIYASTDNGITWAGTNLGNFGYFSGLAYGNGTYVAVGQSGLAYSSSDGINWTARSSGTSSTIDDVAFGNNVFVASLDGNTNVLTSPNGINWTLQPTGLTGTYNGIVFREGLFYVAGTRIATSANGVTWTDRGSPSTVLNGIEKRLNNYVAYGSSGTLLTSTNLTNWATIPTSTVQEMTSAVYGNDSFVVVGRGGVIFQSDYLTNTPVSIVTSPSPTSALAGGTARFSVAVAGRAPFSYQWFKNGKLISGATDSTLTLTGVTAADVGSYHAVVNNDTSSATSTGAALGVVLVTVQAQPENLYAFEGGNAVFTAVVTGATPLAYQWYSYFNVLIPGATNSTFVITNAQPDASGIYHVTVTFTLGKVTSEDSYFSVLGSLEEVSLYTDPGYLAVPVGWTVTINPVVQGPEPSSYQWFKNDILIAGATNASLVFTNAQLTNSADYTFSVAYALGQLTNSSPATVLVYEAPSPVITGIELISPGALQISFTGLPDRYYQVDYATNLVPPVTWDYYYSGQLTANPAVFVLPYPVYGAENRAFFRVKILPP